MGMATADRAGDPATARLAAAGDPAAAAMGAIPAAAAAAAPRRPRVDTTVAAAGLTAAAVGLTAGSGGRAAAYRAQPRRAAARGANAARAVTTPPVLAE